MNLSLSMGFTGAGRGEAEVLILESLLAANLTGNVARRRADLAESKHFCEAPSMFCGEFPTRPAQGSLPAGAGNSVVWQGFRFGLAGMVR
jgi:hypothetical protein